MALKMATGSGKTVVMAMLIAWQALNKLDNRQDAAFSDAFLIVTPGITIRDRLRVLLPTDPDNYYRQRDVLPPPDLLERLAQARILITNYHAFLLHERGDAARLTKAILTRGEPSPFVETPDQMVRRVCRDLGGKKNIIVINDEAHHCYRRKPDAEAETLSGEDRSEAEKREEEARVWLSGLEAVKNKIGVKAIYDLSATPFFLKGSGYPEGTLFPWVVSDFSLIDAIESGHRESAARARGRQLDDRRAADLPRLCGCASARTCRRRAARPTPSPASRSCPRSSRARCTASTATTRSRSVRWEQNAEARARGLTPPVFVVVCNNTNVSKLVFDYVAGWTKTLADGATVVVPGACRCSTTRRAGAGRRGRTRSWWTPSSWNRARA